MILQRLLLLCGVFCGLVFGATEGLAPSAYAREGSNTHTTESALQAYEGRTVEAILIHGLKRIEVEAVIGKIQIKKGQPLSSAAARNDIESIFKMGYFDDIEVRATPGAGNQVKIIYVLRERPVITELAFEGNERISTEDLKGVIRVKEWSILDINRVREDISLIQKHYEEKGFYLAKVTHSVEKIKDDEVKLIYRVNDFDKVRIKRITFLNNKVFTDEQLKAVFQETREGGLFSFISGAGSFKEAAFKQDLDRLRYWYLDHGFVKFRFESPVVTISDDKRFLYVSIFVEEGEEYTMGKIDFAGDLLFTKEDLHSDLTLTEKQTFRISSRNADIQRLTEKYQDLGYAYVNVIPKMEFHDEARTIDFEYHFEKGNLVYFGQMNIAGNSKTYDKVIRRELRIHEGELYHGTNLRVSRERIERLGYFQPGEVVFNTTARKGRPDIMDIEISVKERSTGTITLGAGYGSVQKFFLQTQVSEINLLGRGQTLSFQAQYAADRISKSVNLGFTDPYAFDTKWSLGFDVFSMHYPIPNKYLVSKLGFDIRAGYPLADDVNAYITYKNEGLKISDKQDSTIDTSLDQGILSSVVWNVVRDKRNNRFETTHGNYQSVSAETAGLGGDKNFLKWNLNNRYYTKLVGELVFRNSTEYGQIAKTSDKGVPPSEKFFLGGPNNMKGYEIFALGPTRINSKGEREPLGGSVEMFSLFELEYPLIREAGLKWVFFFDAGNSFDRFPGLGDESFILRTDAGFGFRWFSPIGPLRFEWGFPLNPRPWDGSPAFHFFIGPPF